jgi:predicted Ser/Thr protein kinase
MAMRLREPGADIGGYTVVAAIGRGGSGDVYRVTDHRGETAALKLVDAQADDAARARLGREVDALKSLRHDAIPRILDAELDGPEPFLVFEYIDGVSLAHQVADHGALRGEALADLAETVASALAEAHGAGVIHRDVTPANVMMGSRGPVLIDFGLSHRADDPRLTREGMVSGTAGYVAPEVIDGADPSPTADLWAWAATVAFAMLGEAPFGSGRGALSKTLQGKVRLPNVLGAKEVARALSLDVSARPSPSSVVAALRGRTERLARAESVARDAPTRVFDLGEEGQATANSDPWALPPVAVRRPGVIAAIVLALVVAATLAPIVATLATVLLVIIGRTEHRRVASLTRLRARRGKRRGDAALVAVGMPWHLVRAFAEVLPTASIAVFVGGAWAALVWKLAGDGRLASLSGEAGLAWGHAIALGSGLAIADAILWRGPWSESTRDGVRRAAARIAPSRRAARIWALVVVIVVGTVAFALAWATTIWWWPLPPLPSA